MTLNFPYWLVSGVIALALHIGLFVLVLGQDPQGALAEGLHGIEIDLGMLGDFGEQTESQITKLEVPLNQAIKPLQKEAVIEKKIDQNVEPEIEEIVESQAIQETELRVFDEPSDVQVEIELPEDLVEEIIAKEETVLVDDLKLAELNDNQKPNQSDITQTQTKQTTGEANSVHNGGQSGVDQSYLAKLLAQLAQHKRYPLSSRRKAEEGVAILDFQISRTGRVLVSHIQKSSGFNALDKAVLVMLKRAQPFPPVPPDIKGEQIRFTLPIAFRLNG